MCDFNVDFYGWQVRTGSGEVCRGVILGVSERILHNTLHLILLVYSWLKDSCAWLRPDFRVNLNFTSFFWTFCACLFFCQDFQCKNVRVGSWNYACCCCHIEAHLAGNCQLIRCILRPQIVVGLTTSRRFGWLCTNDSTNLLSFLIRCSLQFGVWPPPSTPSPGHLDLRLCVLFCSMSANGMGEEWELWCRKCRSWCFWTCVYKFKIFACSVTCFPSVSITDRTKVLRTVTLVDHASRNSQSSGRVLVSSTCACYLLVEVV